MSIRTIMRITGLFLVILIIACGIAGAGFALTWQLGTPMGPSEIVALIGSIFSGIALVVLINSLAAQIRAINTESDAAVAARQMEVDRIFVERPWLRPYFLDGLQIRYHDRHFNEANAAATLIANFFDSYFLSAGAADQMFDAPQWRAYMSDHITGSPILRQHLDQNAGWYSKALLDFVQTFEPEDS